MDVFDTPAASTAAAEKASTAVGSIVRLDPGLDELVPKDARIEKLAGGFTFIEGPLSDGAFYFTDRPVLTAERGRRSG